MSQLSFLETPAPGWHDAGAAAAPAPRVTAPAPAAAAVRPLEPGDVVAGVGFLDRDVAEPAWVLRHAGLPRMLAPEGTGGLRAIAEWALALERPAIGYREFALDAGYYGVRCGFAGCRSRHLARIPGSAKFGPWIESGRAALDVAMCPRYRVTLAWYVVRAVADVGIVPGRDVDVAHDLHRLRTVPFDERLER